MTITFLLNLYTIDKQNDGIYSIIQIITSMLVHTWQYQLPFLLIIVFIFAVQACSIRLAWSNVMMSFIYNHLCLPLYPTLVHPLIPYKYPLMFCWAGLGVLSYQKQSVIIHYQFWLCVMTFCVTYIAHHVLHHFHKRDLDVNSFLITFGLVFIFVCAFFFIYIYISLSSSSIAHQRITPALFSFITNIHIFTHIYSRDKQWVLMIWCRRLQQDPKLP